MSQFACSRQPLATGGGSPLPELPRKIPDAFNARQYWDPEANSLPDTLTDLTPEQQKQVVATVDTMIVQLRQLERAGEIRARQARLLVHQSQLVIAALSTT
jgi:hypothetical protein